MISRAGQVLRALAGEPQGLSLSEVAKRVELPRSTVHRIVTALETEGLAASASPNGRYRLGSEITRLANGQHIDLKEKVRPHLERLSAEVNETVDLAVMTRDRVSFVDQIASPQRLRAVSAIGAAFPAYCTANGKALLAELPDQRVIKLLPSRLPPMTPNTITARAELLEELAEIRASGIAFDREEHHEGISAVGAVVRDPAGAMAAVSIPVPTQRFPGSEERLAAALRRSVEEMTEHLGDS